MLAAAVTLVLTFGFWISAPSLGVPERIARTAAVLLVAELVLLLASSYGCESGDCTPLASVAGVAARTDVPILTVIFLLVVTARAWRSMPRRT
jgi:hypothetical protein